MEVLFAGVPVSNFAAALGWYEALFGRPADIHVKDDEDMWRVADAAWVYVVQDPARAGHALVTISVSDLDVAVRTLEGRGITAAPIEQVGDAGRKASVTDPDGNLIALAQVT